MLNEIIQHTNEKLRAPRDNYATKDKTEMRDTDVVEIGALLGLLHFISIFKSNHEDLNACFSTDATGNRYIQMHDVLVFDFTVLFTF